MRIALAQLNPVVGDVTGNAGRLLKAVDACRADGVDLLVSSELLLSGYPPRDLLWRPGLVEACEEALPTIADAAGPMTVLVGHPRRLDTGLRPFANAVSVCRDGAVHATYDKRLLPGYDVFDEDRYFTPGTSTCVIEVAGQRLGLLICEDLWHAHDVDTTCRYDVDPVAETVAQGCDVLIALNASPFVSGKYTRHMERVVDIARAHNVAVIAVNQIGGNDDLVFDGRSVAVDRSGTIRAALPGWTECVKVTSLDPGPNAPPVEALDDDPMSELFAALVLGVRDYCHKTGHQRVAIGLSGGIDSALTATIAAAALGGDHVEGVMMPSRYSSDGSLEDAKDLAHRLGLRACRTMSIETLHDAARESLTRELGDDADGLTDENVQARLRGMLLMAVSNATGALVLATGNKSELAMGYCTLYGDMVGAVAVLGDVLKTQVYELSRWINANAAACGFERPPIPERSITKPPSAELRPDQTDQDSLPPYEILDRALEALVDEDCDDFGTISRHGVDPTVVGAALRALDRNEYKREQAAVILKMTPRTFGRGRPMPMAMRWAVTRQE